MTYPDPDVAAFVQEHFVPTRLNMLERTPDMKEATAHAKVPWAPTLIFGDAKGREVRRFTGWLPPRSFLAELRLVQGQFEVTRGQFATAHERFQEIEASFADTEVAAEALYWQGIAAFLAGQRDMSALAECWRRVTEQFPGTRWATHCAVIEDASG